MAIKISALARLAVVLTFLPWASDRPDAAAASEGDTAANAERIIPAKQTARAAVGELGRSGLEAQTVNAGAVSEASGTDFSELENCVLEHGTPTLDSAMSADLAEIAEEMTELAHRVIQRWQPEPWTPRHPPIRDWSITEFYRSPAAVARLSVSQDLTNYRARMLLARLEFDWLIEDEVGIDPEQVLLAHGHALCALEYAEAAGDTTVAMEASAFLDRIDYFVRQLR